MTVLLAIAKFLLQAAPLLACAVCGTGLEEDNQSAFLQGTALLSLMPLGVIGGTVFYIYRRTKAAEAAEPAPEAP